MTLHECLNRGRIKIPLIGRDAKSVLYEIVSLDETLDTDKVVKTLLERENEGSTEMGIGIAIPHARIPGLDSVSVSVGISPEPMDFGGSVLTSVIFVVLAPEKSASDHIRILSAIVEKCSAGRTVEALKNASTSEEVLSILS